jgi:uncharacterized protein (TIGR01319 family)
VDDAGRAIAIIGDVGSTFTKLVGVDTGTAEIVASARSPTSRTDIEAGVERARSNLLRAFPPGAAPSGMTMSSSAGGGLRVVVVGFERPLTLAAGLHASATAGARVVATYAREELARETATGFASSGPDIVLLTGGTDGGDTTAVAQNAAALRSLAPGIPVVVAGNADAHREVAAIFRRDRRMVRFAANVMPRVGELNADAAQREIRRLFVEHVIGRGRFAATSQLAKAIRMPTPAAVLCAARVLAANGSEPLQSPVVVDVGGATTDVHSVIAVDPSQRGYATAGLSDQRVTRSVEGDLGMRENAAALVAAAKRARYLDDEEAAQLSPAATLRVDLPDIIPETDLEHEVDERLAELATAIALHRHAGRLQTTLTDGGAVLRKTGRDLRRASCVVATGGVFAHSKSAGEIVAAALRSSKRQGALVNPEVPVFVDTSYRLWAAGLLAGEHPQTAAKLAVNGLLEPAVQ